MTKSAARGVLLAVDGDSLAHRAYHGIPKTVRGVGGRPVNALVGVANFLTTLWDSEHPSSVLVGWDTLEEPTYRHEALEAYQSGREFEPSILEQLEVLPQAPLCMPCQRGMAFQRAEETASRAAASTRLGGREHPDGGRPR